MYAIYRNYCWCFDKAKQQIKCIAQIILVEER